MQTTHHRNPIMDISNLVNPHDDKVLASSQTQDYSATALLSYKSRTHYQKPSLHLSNNNHDGPIISSLSHQKLCSSGGLISPSVSVRSSPVPQTNPTRGLAKIPSSSPVKELFTCMTCDKSFNRKHHLLSHMVTHSMDYKYVCTIGECKSKFRRNQDLLRHHRKVKH
ncbi:hypothetical protein BJ741DRAFT_588917 [Chytriomyces cf. hyalinus JEL632]|nr:hypothetical protein BJ741DRAFT_588917 [Chytriomyces cf. hyalinus JEL632]